MIRAACVATIALVAWRAWSVYAMGRSLVMPNILVLALVYPAGLVAVLGGFVQFVRGQGANLALNLAVLVALGLHVTTGPALLRRGVLDRVHAHVGLDELKTFAAPWCAGEAQALADRARWPAWLTALDPGGVSVRPICSGQAPTCFALHVEWGGGLVGRWGVAVLPAKPAATPYLEELEPGLYWTDSP